MKQPKVKISPEVLSDFCRRNHIKRLAFFGSVLRDDFGPESDVDVLYEFEPDVVIGWDFFRIQDELSALLGGRKIDFVSFDNISPFLRKRILDEAQVQYAA